MPEDARTDPPARQLTRAPAGGERSWFEAVRVDEPTPARPADGAQVAGSGPGPGPAPRPWTRTLDAAADVAARLRGALRRPADGGPGQWLPIRVLLGCLAVACVASSAVLVGLVDQPGGERTATVQGRPGAPAARPGTGPGESAGTGTPAAPGGSGPQADAPVAPPEQTPEVAPDPVPEPAPDVPAGGQVPADPADPVPPADGAGPGREPGREPGTGTGPEQGNRRPALPPPVPGSRAAVVAGVRTVRDTVDRAARGGHVTPGGRRALQGTVASMEAVAAGRAGLDPLFGRPGPTLTGGQRLRMNSLISTLRVQILGLRAFDDVSRTGAAALTADVTDLERSLRADPRRS